MPEGRVLEGVAIDSEAPVVACRSCGAPIWWGKTAAGKRNPFDVHFTASVERTAVTHFSTCPQAKSWSKR